MVLLQLLNLYVQTVIFIALVATISHDSYTENDTEQDDDEECTISCPDGQEIDYDICKCKDTETTQENTETPVDGEGYGCNPMDPGNELPENYDPLVTNISSIKHGKHLVDIDNVKMLNLIALSLSSLIRLVDELQDDEYEIEKEKNNYIDLVSRPIDPGLQIDEIDYIMYTLKLLTLTFEEIQANIINPGQGENNSEDE